MTPDRLARAGVSFVSCYADGIPDFIEAALARRYETLHSSLPFFRLFRTVDHVNCYVAWCDDTPVDIFLFLRKDRYIQVLNEMIEVDAESLQLFVEYVFESFPEVELIRFEAIKSAACRGFPVQHYNNKDTFVINLPDSPEDYTASIGKSTRANLRHQLNVLRRTFPTFEMRFFENGAIDDEAVRKIVKLSEDRIQSRGKKVRHDIDNILALTRSVGFVSLLLIDGSICAGSVNYRIESSIFGEVIAYDPEYEKYGLGKICVHETICESIRRGDRRFYLGGGVFSFKERMMGRKVEMARMNVYRSYPNVLKNLDHATAAWLHDKVRLLKASLHKRNENVMARAVFRLFHAFQTRSAKKH